MKTIKYQVTNRETGIIISRQLDDKIFVSIFDYERDADAFLADLEREDKAMNVYEENFYSVLEVDALEAIENEISENGKVWLFAENVDEPYWFCIKKEKVGFSIDCETLSMKNFTTDNTDNGISCQTDSLEDILKYMGYII